ncbi:MAG: hypothetical protein LBE85_10845 [Candidatus Accumulibacter sp.]|nr:hypothetical protein [Accumulibacter sp.]
MKVTKDAASRFFVSGYSGALSLRNPETEVEPVHTATADGEPSTAWNRTEEASEKRKLHLDPPGDQEGRRQERRQRQVRVLLDTRVAQSRRDRSIDESA